MAFEVPNTYFKLYVAAAPSVNQLGVFAPLAQLGPRAELPLVPLGPM